MFYLFLKSWFLSLSHWSGSSTRAETFLCVVQSCPYCKLDGWTDDWMDGWPGCCSVDSTQAIGFMREVGGEQAS